MSGQFYIEARSEALRLGDVLTGLLTATPNLPKPNNGTIENYKIEVNGQKYWANLTPCCSTGENTLMLCALVPVLRSWLDNPLWAENLLMINDLMGPEESVPPDKWKGFSPDEQVKRIQVGRAYALIDYFIYDAHQILNEYPIKVRGTTYQVRNYAIDFRKIQAVKVSGVQGGTSYPSNIKVLELAPQARNSLRNKIAEFFARVPEEDRPFLPERSI